MDLIAALSDSDSPIVEEKLLSLGSDAENDEQLLDACGEALGMIWARKGSLPQDRLLELSKIAAVIAEGTFSALARIRHQHT